MDIKNISPLGALYIPVLGLEVAAGAIISIADAAAAASLLEQSDNWAPVADTKTNKPTPSVSVDPAPAA